MLIDLCSTLECSLSASVRDFSNSIRFSSILMASKFFSSSNLKRFISSSTFLYSGSCLFALLKHANFSAICRRGVSASNVQLRYSCRRAFVLFLKFISSRSNDNSIPRFVEISRSIYFMALTLRTVRYSQSLPKKVPPCLE